MLRRAVFAGLLAAFWVLPSVAGAPSASVAWEALQQQWRTEVTGQPVAAVRFRQDGDEWWIGATKVPVALIRDEQARDEFLLELIESEIISEAFGTDQQCISIRGLTVLRIWKSGSEVRAVAAVPVNGLSKSAKCENTLGPLPTESRASLQK